MGWALLSSKKMASGHRCRVVSERAEVVVVAAAAAVAATLPCVAGGGRPVGAAVFVVPIVAVGGDGGLQLVEFVQVVFPEHSLPEEHSRLVDASSYLQGGLDEHVVLPRLGEGRPGGRDSILELKKKSIFKWLK